MKYIHLSIFISILIASSLCEKTSFLKVNSTADDVTQTPEPKTYSGYCFMKMKNQFYDLNQFNMIKPWKLKDVKGNLINFNFCSNIDTSCHPNDVLIADSKACKKYAGKAEDDKIWTISKDKKKNDVLTIQFPSGDSCGGKNFYQTTVVLTCDRKFNVPTITNNKSFDTKKCKNVIRISSKHACSTGRFSAWWNQFGIPKQGLAAILILIGLWFIIFGVKFWKTNSVLINCAILGLILNSFLSLFFKINLGLCMIIGILIAFLAASFEAFNAVILGVVVGYLFGSLLYNLLVKVVPGNPQALYWSTLITCILFISIAGGFMKAYMVCVATSLVGAYAFVRGISVFAGGYPDETYVQTLINKGEYSQFGRVFGPMIYMYIGGIFLLTGIGFWIQSYMVEPEKTEDDKSKETNAAAATTTTSPNTDKVEENKQTEKVAVTTQAETKIEGAPENKTENVTA